eukprot:389937_1
MSDNSVLTSISNCSTRDILLSIICGSINIILIIMAVPLMYKSAQNYRAEYRNMYKSNQRSRSRSVTDRSVPKPLLHSGIIFSIMTFITLCLAMPYNFHCDDHQIFNLLTKIFAVFYSLHCYLILIIWFFRIYYVFRNTPFLLSKCTIGIYTFFLIVAPFIITYCVITLSTDSTFGFIVYVLFIIMFFMFMFSLVTLFVKKLVSIYKFSQQDKDFIMIVTRSTVLTTICFTFICIYGILVYVRSVNENYGFLRNLF